jgi:spoIIIJ-associated protein
MPNEFKECVLKFIQLLVFPVLSADFTTEIEKEGDQWRFNILSEKSDVIVGIEGELLRSIQHLIRVLVHRKFPSDRTHFLIDVNNYRKNREYAISTKIPDIAMSEVLNKGNTVILVGMSGYERLKVHTILSEIKGLKTSSVGPEDNRKLLIMPTSETGSGSMDSAKIVHIDQIKM